MAERIRTKDIIITGALTTLGVLALSRLAFYGFSQKTKDEAFHKQGCVCPVCRTANHRKWEGHHAIPDSLGGISGVENCLTVGGDKTKDCHEVVDRAALDHGTIFLPPNGPFIPIQEAPPELFKNEGVHQRALRRFKVGEAISGTIEFVAGKVSNLTHKERVKHERVKKHKRKKYRGQGGRRR